MEKISWGKMVDLFRRYEQEHPENHLSGFVVFTKSSFDVPYSLESRTYCVSSNNKAFQPNMNGYSIYGSAIDGSDPLVRLDQYMSVEQGGKNGWHVDYCYMEES